MACRACRACLLRARRSRTWSARQIVGASTRLLLRKFSRRWVRCPRSARPRSRSGTSCAPRLRRNRNRHRLRRRRLGPRTNGRPTRATTGPSRSTSPALSVCVSITRDILTSITSVSGSRATASAQARSRRRPYKPTAPGSDAEWTRSSRLCVPTARPGTRSRASRSRRSRRRRRPRSRRRSSDDPFLFLLRAFCLV